MILLRLLPLWATSILLGMWLARPLSLHQFEEFVVVILVLLAVCNWVHGMVLDYRTRDHE